MITTMKHAIASAMKYIFFIVLAVSAFALIALLYHILMVN